MPFSLTPLLLLPILLLAGCRSSGTNEAFSTPVKSVRNRAVELSNDRIVPIPASARVGTTLLVLVRHSEKGTGDDPPLTEEGRRRSAHLANILEELELDAVYASPFRRTIQTAEPVADAKKLEIESYDPGELEDFLDLLLEQYSGERILVVGHSNTTPQLLNLLQEEQHYEQIADSDYGNLYVVAVERNGPVHIQAFRFEPG